MQKTAKTTGIVWLRNDLRLRDNTSFYKATRECAKVIAVYCIDPRQFAINSNGFRKTEKYRAKFLLETLENLKKELNSIRISLIVTQNYPEVTLPGLCEKFEADTVFLQKEWTSEEIKIFERNLN